MKISISRDDKGYSVETIRANTLVVLGEFERHIDAIRYAKWYVNDTNGKRGDEVWDWDGIIWHYTGTKWRTICPMD